MPKIQKKILFTVIEGDRNNINNNTNVISTPRMYEQEAILCFENWRKNAGWLKDIEIICYAPTKNLPTSDTISRLKDLNVTYVEQYLPICERMEFGFFLVPLVGKILETENPDSTLIHIDLDMNIIKPIPEKYFDDKVYIGQYDDSSAMSQRKANSWENPLDTGFTISPSSKQFYNMFWREFRDLYFDKSYEQEEDWLNQDADNGVCFLEEYVADKLLNKNLMEINTIQFYQLGEGYAKVSDLNDEELEKVLFWHEHLFLEDDSHWAKTKVRQKIEFFKRTKKGKK